VIFVSDISYLFSAGTLYHDYLESHFIFIVMQFCIDLEYHDRIKQSKNSYIRKVEFL